MSRDPAIHGSTKNAGSRARALDPAYGVPRSAAPVENRYWVIDAVRLITRIHRPAGPDGYGDTVDVPHRQMLPPGLLPALAVRLADLGLEPMMEH